MKNDLVTKQSQVSGRRKQGYLLLLMLVLALSPGCRNSTEPVATEGIIKDIISKQYINDIKKAGAGNVKIDTVNITGKTLMKRTPEIYSVEYYISGRIFSGNPADSINKNGVRFMKKESVELQVKADSTGTWLNGPTFP
jgi:hypothetical protein